MKIHYILQLIYGFTFTFFSCDATMQVRHKMEAELKELEHVCDLLKAAGENQQKLLAWERICAQKCKTLGELELQVVRTCWFLKINEKIMW